MVGRIPASHKRRCAWRTPARYRLPLAGLPQFADAAFDQVPLEHAEVLDKKDAVQVIDFVTERASQQAFAAHLVRFTLDVLRANSHVGRAQHRAAKSGYRKTPF